MSETTSVVIVHGLWMTGFETLPMRRMLQAQTGWHPRRFSYRSVRDTLETSARKLHDFIESLPAGPVHLVAHSLGGVVVHHLMHSDPPDRPGRVVLLCSPIQGSAAARSVAALPGGHVVLGAKVRAALLEDQAKSWESEREVGIVAGTQSLGAGRFVSRLASPNDGTVAVAETELPGATDRIVLPVSHSAAMFSRDVARQVAEFLQRGHFLKQP